jgi:hypothetical protein
MMFNLIGAEDTGTTMSAAESQPTPGIPEAIDVPIRGGKAKVALTGGSIPGYVYVSAFAIWSRTTTASAGDAHYVAVYDDPCFPAVASLTPERSIPSSGVSQASVSVVVMPAAPDLCPRGVVDGTPVTIELRNSSASGADKSGATADPETTVTQAGAARFTVRAGDTAGTVNVRAIVGMGLKTDDLSIRLAPSSTSDSGPNVTRTLPDASRTSGPDAEFPASQVGDGGVDVPGAEQDSEAVEAGDSGIDASGVKEDAKSTEAGGNDVDTSGGGA